jgi:threonine-phosphate decarboxylase
MKEFADTKVGAESFPAHGGRRAEAERRYGIPKEELLDFSASINLLGPSPAAVSAVKKALAEIAYYPEEEPVDLAIAMADHLGVFPDEIALGNGSIEIIYWLAAMLRPRKALVVDPTFSEYRRACLAAGSKCDSFLLLEEEDFALDVEQVRPQGYDLVFICNPNNPTGYLVPVDEIAALWRRCRAAGAGLVVDEAFMDFVGGEESILSYGVAEGLYVIRSLTKSYALAGLRLGCLAAPARFVAKLKRRLPPWNINSFARVAAAASLADNLYL